MKVSSKDFFRIILLHLSFSKVNVSDEPFCITGIEKGSSCPATEQEHNFAAERKKCWTKESKCANQQVPQVYHCLPNAWGNESFELCAPEIEVIGFCCPEYNEGGRRIQPSFHRKCDGNNSEIKCPFKYLSSRSYLYSACLLFFDEAISNVSEKENSTIPDLDLEIANEKNSLPIIIAFPLLFLLVSLILSVVIKCVWNHWKGDSKQIQRDQIKGTRVPEEKFLMLTSEEVHIDENKE